MLGPLAKQSVSHLLRVVPLNRVGQGMGGTGKKHIQEESQAAQPQPHAALGTETVPAGEVSTPQLLLRAGVNATSGCTDRWHWWPHP